MAMSNIPLLIHGVLFMMFSFSSSISMWFAACMLAVASYGQFKAGVFKGFFELRKLRGWATLLVLLGGVFSVAYVYTGGVFGDTVVPVHMFRYLGWLIVGMSILDFQDKKR